MTETAMPDLFDGLEAWKAYLEKLHTRSASEPGLDTLIRHAEHTIHMLQPTGERPSPLGPGTLKDWQVYLDEVKTLPAGDAHKQFVIDEVEETIEALVDLAEEDEGGDIDG